jgi:cytochrome P450
MSERTSTTTSVPERYRSTVDLFSEQSLADPYDDYRQLRDVDPIAYLDRYDMWTVTRYDEVRRVLRDSDTFISGEGIGMNQTLNDAWHGMAPTLDREDHRPLRRVMVQSIGPKVAPTYGHTIERIAHDIIEDVVARGEFDAIPHLAERLPTTAVLELIGVDPDEQTRHDLLHWATDAYNCCGPDGTFDHTWRNLAKLYEWALKNYTRENLRPGGIGQQTWDAVEQGTITEEQAIGILAGYATAGLDTTSSAIGSLVLLFAQHPDQWALVRDDPDLVPSAGLEGTRLETPAQWFTRVTSQDVEFGELTVEAGTRILHSYGAANRDERHYPDPDRFDVTRNPKDTLAFGYGVHLCTGRTLSDPETHALFRNLAQRVERFELVDEPERHISNLIRGLSRLPIRIHPR